MISHQNTIFPIKFKYNGQGFDTKVLKDTYSREVLYKIAMPSAVSPVQQCWLALDKAGNYNLIMGNIPADLQKQIITAIEQQEHIQTIYSKTGHVATPELRSA